MAKRKLKNGKYADVLNKPMSLEIFTRVPEKWKIIDMETGEQYVGTKETERYKQWKRILIKS